MKSNTAVHRTENEWIIYSIKNKEVQRRVMKNVVKLHFMIYYEHMWGLTNDSEICWFKTNEEMAMKEFANVTHQNNGSRWWRSCWKRFLFHFLNNAKIFLRRKTFKRFFKFKFTLTHLFWTIIWSLDDWTLCETLLSLFIAVAIVPFWICSTLFSLTLSAISDFVTTGVGAMTASSILHEIDFGESEKFKLLIEMTTGRLPRFTEHEQFFKNSRVTKRVSISLASASNFLKNNTTWKSRNEWRNKHQKFYDRYENCLE